ncbi:MAG: ribonuclease E/G, partial [Geminicoccaceae bacterium]
GYIVIGVTEALVAIDVNSGRATKEGSIEETALKTNLEAAEEVARQLRLRDLAGLIVIDFIDMEERKNNASVEKRMKDKLKTDRARIQVGRISGFGLMEMSRQRLRPGMIEATTQPCPHCHGTGLIRSDDNLALNILRQIEEEGTRRRSREVLLKAPVGIVNYLMNHKREHIAQIEQRYGMGIRLEADPFLISPDFSLEKFKTATRAVPEAAPVISVDATYMDPIDEEDLEEDLVDEVETSEESEAAETGEQPKKKRRRRRRKSRSKTGVNGENGESADGTETGEDQDAAEADADAGDAGDGETTEAEDGAEAADAEAEADASTADEAGDEAEAEKPKSRSRSRRSRSRKKKTDDEMAAEVPSDAEAPVEDAVAEEAAPETPPADEPVTEAAATEDAVVEEAVVEAAPAAEVVAEAAPVEEFAEAAATAADSAPEPANVDAAAEEDVAEDDKPKKKGWWSMSR